MFKWYFQYMEFTCVNVMNLKKEISFDGIY